MVGPRKAQLAARIATAVHETLVALRDPTLLVWALYLAMVPIYLWASGLPQIGDVLSLILVPLGLTRWNGRLGPMAASSVRVLIVFTAYVVLVNLVWSFVLNSWTTEVRTGFLMTPLFYIYNALMFVVTIVLYRTYQARMLRLTSRFVLLTLISQVALSLAMSGGHRATVLFNNPNQLGYYALLSASVMMVLQRRGHVSTLEVTVGTVAATYLALASASKAALAGIGLLVIAGMISRLRTMLLVAATCGLLLLLATPMQRALGGAVVRIANDESLGFVEERGYDRILHYPEYWVLGAGEGAYKRFEATTKIRSHEIHSSIGSLFFCYGFVGTLMFGAFLWSVLRRSGIRMWFLIMPTLSYGMTHQGLRFTLFWVLLAIVVALREESIVERADARASPMAS
ncbi:MAG: hypothetical protein AB7R00_18090 [Kofleriaceae bacterium]